MGPKHKLFSTICSDQDYLWIFIGGTLTRNLFGDFQLSKRLLNMPWWILNTKAFQGFAVIEKTYCFALVGPEHQILGRFSGFKKTYEHELMGPKHKIFSVIFSYQEYLLTCVGGTWTQTLFSDLQLSRILIGMHWWDLNTKSFRRFQLSRILICMHWRDFNTNSFRQFAAIKNNYSHAMIGPKHKIISAICSDQEYLWMCIGGTLTQNPFGDFQLSRILMNIHWWNVNTKSFQRFAAIKKTYCYALVGP